jgi:hypothetical protein
MSASVSEPSSLVVASAVKPCAAMLARMLGRLALPAGVKPDLLYGVCDYAWPVFVTYPEDQAVKTAHAWPYRACSAADHCRLVHRDPSRVSPAFPCREALPPVVERIEHVTLP